MNMSENPSDSSSQYTPAKPPQPQTAAPPQAAGPDVMGTVLPNAADGRRKSHANRMFYILFFLVAFGAIVCAHWLSTEVRRFYVVEHPTLARLLICAVVVSVGFFASVFWAFRWRLRLRGVLGPLMLALIFGHLASFDLYDLFEHWSGTPGSSSALGVETTIVGTQASGHLTTLLVAIAMTLLFGWALHELEHRLETARTLKRHTPAQRLAEGKPPIVALVLFVSPPNWVPGKDGNGNYLIGPSEKDAVILNGTLSDDIKKFNKANLGLVKWQQLMRGILPHQKLQNVWLICSHGNPGIPTPFRKVEPSEGSEVYFDDCAAILRRYLPGTCQSPIKVVVNDIENFDEVMAVLRDKVLHHTDSVGPDQIAVDITGGIKISSIAGAVLTLNRETVVQYVQTGARDTGQAEPEASIYDFRWDKPRVP